MIANYGYMDASGEYFITVDCSKCVLCEKKPCVTACPKRILEIIENDYGEKVMSVKEDSRKKLNFVCSECKPNISRPPLPCVNACPFNAIKHSW